MNALTVLAEPVLPVARGQTALPATPESVTAFLAAQAAIEKRASTLQRRLAAIGYTHKIANVPSPLGAEAIRATLAGIRRSIRAAPQRKKAATSDIVRHGRDCGR
jgi:hypothetical protein